MPQITFPDRIRKELEAIGETYTIRHKKKHIQIWFGNHLATTLPHVRSRSKGPTQEKNSVASIRKAVKKLREERNQ